MTADVWLPIPPETIEGLPEGPAYRHWDGEETYPADPADCAFYVVPYMKPGGVGVRPLPEMRSVQVVQTLSAGIDHVEPGLKDLPPGVRLCNARGVHEASTAELTLALILASLRGIPDFVRAQDRGEWLGGGFRPALADRTVLIVGYGSIGAAIEDRLVPFEVAPVVATPLTEATRGLADAEFLARMKDGALLVNVARGPVVDTKALLAELESGRLTAALDVTDPEPLPPGHPLWHAPGIVVSPHAGGPTSAFLPRAERLLVDQLRRFVNREPLRNVILTTGP
jgi:phosphoglycerate dehydrogenase-like enzyme